MKNNKDMNFFDSFKYNYKNTPGFESGLKLLMFIVFSIVLIVFARATIASEKKYNATTTTVTRISGQTDQLKKILDATISQETEITIEGPNDLVTKLTNVKETDGVVTGYLKSKEKGIKEYRIRQKAIYELDGAGNEFETDDLLPKVDVNFLVPSELVRILETNKTVVNYYEDSVVYSYFVESNETTNDIKVLVKDNKVNNIFIKNDIHTYEITYK